MRLHIRCFNYNISVSSLWIYTLYMYPAYSTCKLISVYKISNVLCNHSMKIWQNNKVIISQIDVHLRAIEAVLLWVKDISALHMIVQCGRDMVWRSGVHNLCIAHSAKRLCQWQRSARICFSHHCSNEDSWMELVFLCMYQKPFSSLAKGQTTSVDKQMNHE